MEQQLNRPPSDPHKMYGSQSRASAKQEMGNRKLSDTGLQVLQKQPSLDAAQPKPEPKSHYDKFKSSAPRPPLAS